MKILRIILLVPGFVVGIFWGLFKTGCEAGEKFYYKQFE